MQLIRQIAIIPSQQLPRSMANSLFKMATGTYPMGTGHSYPHPSDQNLTHRVTRIHIRVENSFHTRTRRVILTRRVTHTQQYTRVHTPKYNSFQQNKSTIEQQNRNISRSSQLKQIICLIGSFQICLYGDQGLREFWNIYTHMLIWAKYGLYAYMG